MRKDTEVIDFLTTSYSKYGALFVDWLYIIPMVFVLEPKYLQTIIGSSKYTDKPFVYTFMHNFLGEGLVTNSGYKWKVHRKYIQPYFNLNILEQFIPAFVESSQVLVKNLSNLNEIQISSKINKCVFDMMHDVVFGIPLADKVSKALSPFNHGQKVFMERASKLWLFLHSIYTLTSSSELEIKQRQALQEFTKNAIKSLTLKKINKQDPANRCLLECLMEIAANNSDFTDDDIIDETTTFMLAGQDSVSSAVSFTLFYLAKHQDIQEKVIQELNPIFLRSKLINMETLNEMKYLEQCIKEAMRLCPSIPIVARKVAEDVTVGKHVIPAGCTIIVSPIATHRLPQYYPNPEKYDPERFSEINQEERHPFAYLPFSAGPRNCIGYKFAMLEMKTLISLLLQSYQLFLVPGKENLVTGFRITLRAKGGIWLILKPRKPVA